MATPPFRPQPSAAGGVLITIGALLGTAIGFGFGETTAGFLGGLALGAVAAVLVWLRDRR
jgi:hypothetical protein